MTDIDSLTRLEAALPLLQSAVDQQHLGKALTRASGATADMQRHIERLTALGATLALLPDYLDGRALDIRNVAEDILDLGDAMKAAESSDDLDDIVRDVRKIDQFLSALHRVAVALASAYCRDNVAPLRALEGLFGRMGRTDLADAVDQLHKKESALAAAGNALPAKLAELQDARKSLASELTALASDPEVDAFMTSFARVGSVSLSLVTAKVLDWLADQSALDQFTVNAID